MNFLAPLIPFLMLGVGIVVFAFGIILLAYLLIFGAIVGMAIFLIAWVRAKFFPKKEITTYQRKERKGQTIDHNDQ